MQCIPKGVRADGPLKAIAGTVPNASEFPEGCRFHTRCDRALDLCRRERPPLAEVEPGHRAACWLYGAAGKTEGES